jgi:cell division protein FtsN
LKAAIKKVPEPEQKAQPPAAVAKAPPPAKPEAPATAGGPLAIQAASFKDPKDADKMVAALEKKGYRAYKTIVVFPEKGIWFRVRVGDYASRTDAAADLARLQKDGYSPIVVEKK